MIGEVIADSLPVDASSVTPGTTGPAQGPGTLCTSSRAAPVFSYCANCGVLLRESPGIGIFQQHIEQLREHRPDRCCFSRLAGADHCYYRKAGSERPDLCLCLPPDHPLHRCGQIVNRIYNLSG